LKYHNRHLRLGESTSTSLNPSKSNSNLNLNLKSSKSLLALRDPTTPLVSRGWAMTRLRDREVDEKEKGNMEIETETEIEIEIEIERLEVALGEVAEWERRVREIKDELGGKGVKVPEVV
jgi:hypothetical protein